MKIGIDVDGVITEVPAFFSVITSALIAAGHEVFIITDFDEHWRTQRIAELAKYGIAYTELIITADKAAYCRENGVEYLIDDDFDYFAGAPRVAVGIGKMKPGA